MNHAHDSEPSLLRARRLTMVPDMINFPRIKQWHTSMRSQHLSDRTMEARLWRVTELAAYIGHDPSDATSAEIVDFMAMLADRPGYKESRVSASTLATYHSHLKAWFAYLVLVDYRVDDPMSKVRAARGDKRIPRPVTDRQLLAIFAVPVYRRTRMMLLLATFQGLRVHEIAKIKGEHVNLLDNKLRVLGKGGHDAELPLNSLVAEEAANYPAKGYWFPQHKSNLASEAGGPILARSVSDIIGNVFDRAKVDGGAHRLRHWYGTNLLNGGANIRTVQSLLRHASIQTTELYTEVNATDQQAAIRNLGMPKTDEPEAGTEAA